MQAGSSAGLNCFRHLSAETSRPHVHAQPSHDHSASCLARGSNWRNSSHDCGVLGGADDRADKGEDEEGRDDVESREGDRIFNDLLVAKLALRNCAQKSPTYAHLVGPVEMEEPADFKGPSDHFDEEFGQQLLHVGKEPVSLNDFSEMELAALKVVARNVSRREPVVVSRYHVFEFTAARIEEEVVQSKAHLAVVSLGQSYHVPVKVRLQRGGSAKILNADVLRFVKVTNEEKGDSFS
jgi:hypothetical protein